MNIKNCNGYQACVDWVYDWGTEKVGEIIFYYIPTIEELTCEPMSEFIKEDYYEIIGTVDGKTAISLKTIKEVEQYILRTLNQL